MPGLHGGQAPRFAKNCLAFCPLVLLCKEVWIFRNFHCLLLKFGSRQLTQKTRWLEINSVNFRVRSCQIEVI